MRVDTHVLASSLKDLQNKPLYVLIWTITPWSLIANQAFSNNIVYCIVENSSKNLYILAQECLASIEQKLGPLKLITTIMGNIYSTFLNSYILECIYIDQYND